MPNVAGFGKQQSPKRVAFTFSVSLAIAAGLAFWIARPSRDVRPNVLLITIDTLRADHVGSYGYKEAQTPAIDAIAARGLRFAHATTVAPLTLPAHASLMTGTFPWYHHVRDNGGFYLSDDQETLAKVLRARGYRTGGFVAALCSIVGGVSDRGSTAITMTST